MEKVYRIIGKRGRTTLPYDFRVLTGIRPNDLVSFRREGDEIVIRRERICDNCQSADHSGMPATPDALRNFLGALPAEAQKEALIYLSLEIAQAKG